MPGFSKPTTTQTPDALFDYWLTRITGSELRVLLYAVRRTFGFMRDEDNISLDQFLHGIRTRDGRVQDDGIGISRSALLVAIKSLGEKGLLLKVRNVDSDGYDAVSTYRISILDARHPRAAHGLREVNTTQMPDEIVDYWLPRLSDAELKVLLYIVRRTLGFKKQADAIRPVQFQSGVRSHAGDHLDDGCGVSEKHLYRALTGLKDKGLITAQRRVSDRTGNKASVFTLVFENDLPSLLKATADVDPRARDYRLDDDESVTVLPLPIMGPQGARKDREGEQKGLIGGAEKTGSPPGRHDGGDQKRPGGGAERTDRGDGRDWKGYTSKMAPQQTDPLLNQQTERQDIESTPDTSPPSFSTQPRGMNTPDPLEQRIYALVAEFGDTASPRASATKAAARFGASGLPISDFIALVDEAADRVRRYRPAKPLAYFFTTLDSCIQAVQEQHRTTTDREATPHAPAPITEADPAWHAALEDMQSVITRENYAMWFAGTHVVIAQGDRRVVAVPTVRHKAWLEQKLASRIQTSLAQCGFGHIRIDFVVADETYDADERATP